jgi:hypothetical protein
MIDLERGVMCYHIMKVCVFVLRGNCTIFSSQAQFRVLTLRELLAGVYTPEK